MEIGTGGERALPRLVLDTLIESGADFYVSVPCNTLAGLLRVLDEDERVRHVPVTREEEGLGICAGAALAGRLPVLVMQNSGLGNCLNALLSCSQYYRLPLVILASYRGGPDEVIDAQRPMGRAMRGLLTTVGVPYGELERPDQAPALQDLVRAASRGEVVAAIVHPRFWKVGA